MNLLYKTSEIINSCFNHHKCDVSKLNFSFLKIKIAKKNRLNKMFIYVLLLILFLKLFLVVKYFIHVKFMFHKNKNLKSKFQSNKIHKSALIVYLFKDLSP